MQKAIELNDNRAVFRSRLLLDSDLASRSAALGRIYNDLGFQQRGLVEGWKAVNDDPSNYSAHRLLADNYASLPRHEIARVSELLQSQLLQPINITPVQPQLAESNLLILDGLGPQSSSFNEFNPLFARNRLALQASGIYGNNNTWGEEVTQSGLWNNFSYSLGQLRSETNGFRRNNDLKKEIYNAFIQMHLFDSSSVQIEWRKTNTEFGDRNVRFFPEDFLPNRRVDVNSESIRLGLHHAFSQKSDLIASFIYRHDEDDRNDRRVFTGNNTFVEVDGYFGEVQYLHRWNKVTAIVGAGHLSTRGRVNAETISFTPDFDPPPPSQTKEDIEHTNGYIYTQIKPLNNITLAVGISADFFEGPAVQRNQINPKVGITWNPLANTRLRLAAFKTQKRSTVSDQTIEPTQVAGFNQFFDGARGEKAWRHAFAIDQRFSNDVLAGIEISKRDLKVPVTGGGETQNFDVNEHLGRAYLYWTPNDWCSTSIEYQFEKVENDTPLGIGTGVEQVETHRIPLGLNCFHGKGLFSKIKATYFNQRGKFKRQNARSGFISDNDDFWLMNLSIGYRLPKRFGIIEFGVNNLLDEKFKFQTTDPSIVTIQPNRTIYTTVTLNF
jgi:hypothetical protein